MTTITTVGYGDIHGTCSVEKIVCVFLHLTGVLSYSFLSGALTAIIFTYDTIGQKNTQQIQILDRLLEDTELPSDLYNQMKLSVENQDDIN